MSKYYSSENERAAPAANCTSTSHMSANGGTRFNFRLSALVDPLFFYVAN